MLANRSYQPPDELRLHSQPMLILALSSKAYSFNLPPCLGLALGLDLLITFRTGTGTGAVLHKAYRFFVPPCLGLAFRPRPPNCFRTESGMDWSRAEQSLKI